MTEKILIIILAGLVAIESAAIVNLLSEIRKVKDAYITALKHYKRQLRKEKEGKR